MREKGIGKPAIALAVVVVIAVAAAAVYSLILKPEKGEGLRIVFKDQLPLFFSVKQIQPTITEIHLQRSDGTWTMIWSGETTLTLTPDDVEYGLATVDVDAGTYVAVKFFFSSISAELDLNGDGDYTDENLEVSPGVYVDEKCTIPAPTESPIFLLVRDFVYGGGGGKILFDIGFSPDSAKSLDDWVTIEVSAATSTAVGAPSQGFVPVYPGATELEWTKEQVEARIYVVASELPSDSPLYLPPGASVLLPPDVLYGIYSTSADPSTVLGWYRTQMSGWTAYFDHTGAHDGYTCGMLLYVKENDSVVIGVLGTATGTEILLFYLPSALPLPPPPPPPLEDIPVYTGATDWGMTTTQLEAMLGQSLPGGIPVNYWLTSADPSTVLGWYRTQMSEEGWTTYVDRTDTYGGIDFGIIIYTKGNYAAAIITFAASVFDPTATGSGIVLLYVPRNMLPPAG